MARRLQMQVTVILTLLCGLAVAQVAPGTMTQPAGPTQTDNAYYYSTIGQELAYARLREKGGRSRAAGTVGQWERFETVLVNNRSYANPYEDVTLHVTYRSPDGRAVDFWGFYDGNDTWRLRFMPDCVGTWQYEATFSGGLEPVRGTFECVLSDLRGIVTAYKPNPIWFSLGGDRPALLRSLHVGDRFFADRENAITGESWSPSRRTAFLDWAQEQGYNMLSIASHYLNRSSSGRGRGWNTPDLWDSATQRPNPAEYRRMERVLDDLASRGIVVYPFAGFFGRDSDFPRDEPKQNLYIRYTLARLGTYWNVLFLVAGPEPLLGGKPYVGKQDIDRLGRKIRELDVFGHLVSVHNPTGDDAFKNADWTGYGVLQGPKTINRRRLSEGLLRNLRQAGPLYAQETLWGGNKHHPDYSLDDLRKNAFVLLLSGATVNFGDMDGDSSSGFSGTMDPNRRVQSRHDVIRRVWDVFETVPFHEMNPRQDLVSAGYCLAAPGRSYLVYLENPGTVTVELEGGRYQVQWINARATSDRRSPGAATGGTFTSPSDGDDWLLYLYREKQ